MHGRSTYSEGLGFGVLTFGCMVVLTTASSIATARIYGIETLGRYALILAAVNAVLILSTAQERPAFIREIATLPARAPRITGLFLAVFGFSAMLTVLVGLLTTVVVYFVYSGPIGHPELFLPAVVNIAGYVFFDNTNGNLDGVFSAFRAGRVLFWIRMLQAISLFAIAVVLGLTLHNVWGLVFASVGSSVLALGHRAVVIRRYLRFRVGRNTLAEGRKALPGIIAFGLKIAPGGLFDGISAETGTWTLGVISSIPIVGAYNRAWMIVRQFLNFNFRVTEMLFPTLVERRRVGGNAGFDYALFDTVRYMTAALLLLAACIGGAAPGVMALFGPGFAAGNNALAVFALAPALGLVATCLRNALYALEQPLASTISATQRLIVTVCASIALSIWLGPTGAAIALCLGLVVDSAYSWSRVRKALVTPLREAWNGRQMLAAVAAYAVGFAAAQALYTTVPTTPGLLLALAGGGLVYVGAILALGGLLPRDRARLVTLVRTPSSPDASAGADPPRAPGPIGPATPAPSSAPNAGPIR